MTKSELKELLKQLGARAECVSEQILEKVEAEKAELDTETRRKVRSFWIFASVCAFGIGIAVGHLFF